MLLRSRESGANSRFFGREMAVFLPKRVAGGGGPVAFGRCGRPWPHEPTHERVKRKLVYSFEREGGKGRRP